jgi:hypothetical protein
MTLGVCTIPYTAYSHIFTGMVWYLTYHDPYHKQKKNTIYSMVQVLLWLKTAVYGDMVYTVEVKTVKMSAWHNGQGKARDGQCEGGFAKMRARGEGGYEQ